MAHTQTSLTDEMFETAGPETGTRKFAEQMETPVGREGDRATRKALLEASFGTTVIVAGRGYTLGRQHDEPIRCVLSAPLISFLETDRKFAVLDDCIAPRDAACDDGTVPKQARIPLAAVHVRDSDDLSLADALDSTPAAVTTEKDCPDCGPDATTAFREDDVETSYRSRATALPDNPTVEVRYCHECEQTFLRAQNANPDTATIERTRGLYGLSDEPVEIGGLYTLNETCLFRMMKETNAYNGLYTASEVAAFVNAKLDDGEEDDDKDLFGFVSVRDGGDRIVWHDDQPYQYECEFKRVDHELIAARDGSADDDTDREFALPPAETLPDVTLALPTRENSEDSNTSDQQAGYEGPNPGTGGVWTHPDLADRPSTDTRGFAVGD